MNASMCPIVGRKMSPRGSLGLASSANLRSYLLRDHVLAEEVDRLAEALDRVLRRTCAALVSMPSRPPQNTYVSAPSSTPRSIERIVFCSA